MATVRLIIYADVADHEVRVLTDEMTAIVGQYDEGAWVVHRVIRERAPEPPEFLEPYELAAPEPEAPDA